MSDLHISSFFNKSRPQLRQPSVTELPVYALGPDLSSRLRESLIVNPSDRAACATSARLWESLLERQRIPYLLLRVADMRMSLGSKFTALSLYEELQTTLKDPRLGRWIAQSRPSMEREADQQLHDYKTNPSLGFSFSQRWQPGTACNDPFPYCKLQRTEIDDLHNRWRTISSPKDVMPEFLNLHCLETNAIEGTFQFDSSDAATLIFGGFYSPAEPLDVTVGVVRNCADALSILQDTHKALNDIFTFLVPGVPMNLTVETVCHLHAKLMQTSRVLYSEVPWPRLTYLNIGVTRQTSRVNVTATLQQQGVKIQFCPFDQVDVELATFCRRFNELLQQPDTDPFAAAAWISHVFLTIHPFEDGNGRLSRILASIPLLKKGLPPLCVTTFHKHTYHLLLNHTRANRSDYKRLMTILYNGTQSSLTALEFTCQAMRSQW
ncbi:hypothetical protein M413DRAFT_141242 [Hebeloma cylindrosporum]|uniref:Fido domain-containing protein n=1 Tax=Hebeloma cylindrosporum TaxID=76867 RepID=A0A0C2XW95_HEBCY|nr:hypothetical protein M413DRAFT_141242 [Hebeloma cylindrosporum h7]